MRVTYLGHASLLVDTSAGSILCDPWFVPAFFGSWFPFPRNDQLDDELRNRIEHPDFLYITHLHGDHFDEAFLAEHVSRSATVLLPGYPTRELERRIKALGFDSIERTEDRQPFDLGAGVSVAIHVETSITDGPGGDSAMVISDGGMRVVNQNDCRTSDLDALRSHGPVDLHFLQYSGAIWYPMVYEQPADVAQRLVADKVDSQLTRAMRYVEAVDGAVVVPSAGPPCFLDPDLFHLNVITGEEPSIFVDQRPFLQRLSAAGRRGELAIPGTAFDVQPGTITAAHPLDDADVAAIFDDKGAYLRRYQADWAGWLADERASWAQDTTDLLAALQAWFEPLMKMAPTVCAGISDTVVLHAGDESIALDFVAKTVRSYTDQPHSFWFRIDRHLVETVVVAKAVDWSNALFLSCRFTAWRSGAYNEFVYNFFKSLSLERMRRTEAEALRRLDPDRSAMAAEDVRIGDFWVQRTCPHRQADLGVFGEVDGEHLVCTLHGWRFDLHTGECLTAAEHPIRVRRATD